MIEVATSTPSKTSKTPSKVLDRTMIESAKPRHFTADNAEKGLTSAKTTSQRASFVAGAVAEYKKANDLRQTAAAYATKCMLLEGMEQKDIAVVLGLSPASITQYKRMARAYDLGARPGTPVWTGLGSGAGAQDSTVGAVVMDKDATLDKIEKAVSTYVVDKAKGKANSKAKGKTGTPSGSTKQTDNTSTATLSKKQQTEQGLRKDPRGLPAAVDMIEEMLTRIEEGKTSPRLLERLRVCSNRIDALVNPEALEPTGTE